MPLEKLQEPQIVHGCMRLHSLPPKEAARLLETSTALGINFFDHADIYGRGKSEEVFGKALKKANLLREEVVIQTKCGIRPGFYDFSKKHILNSVEGSLKRLGTDYIDILLLHRPDTLMEPDEVAAAFDKLQGEGKVRYFGVSNHNPLQMELLGRSAKQKLAFNQLQFGPVHTSMVDAGINVNLINAGAVNRDGGVLEYCRLRGITIQAWSPFQHGFIEGVFFANPQFAALNEKLEEIASAKEVSKEAIVTAWIMRHPAGIQPIVGTTNPLRLKKISQAYLVELTRREWYEIYLAAGNELP